jgi:hypothetical protein
MDSSLDGASYAKGAYCIEDDLPGRRLVLEWRGPAPRRAFRWLVVLAVVAILGVAFWFARNEWLPVVNREAQKAGGDPLGMAVLGAFLVIGGCVMPFFVVRAASAFTRYVSRIGWDSNDAIFEVVEGGWMLFGRRRRRVPLGSICSLDMTVGSETARGGLPIRLNVASMQDTRRDDVAVTLRVAALDRRCEAMDLLFRIARITGHPRCMILRSDPRELRMALLRAIDSGQEGDELFDDELDELEEDEESDADDDDDDDHESPEDDSSSANSAALARMPARTEPRILDIPPEHATANYQANEPPRGFVEPEVELAPLDLDLLANDLEPARLVEWSPPARFRSQRDPIPRGVLIATAVVFGLIGTGLGAWLLHGFVTFFVRTPPSRWDSAAFGAMVGALLGPLLVWAFNRQREVTIDGPLGTIECRHGELVRSYALKELCEVTLIGQQQSQTETSGSGGKRSTTTYTGYRYRIELAVGQAGEWFFDSGEWDRNPDKGYRPLLGLSVELARALGVPWRWQDDGGQNTVQWFRRLGWKERGAVAALVVSILCYPALMVVKEHWSIQGVERVKEAGADVSFLNKYSIGDLEVLSDYWKIEFTPEGFDYDKLRAVVGAVNQISRAGLLLGGTGMGDSGMVLLSPAKNLLLLDVNSTGVTSEGLSSLEGFDRLEYLGLANTIVGDSGLERLPPLPRLRFLMLATTRISDAGLVQLEKFPSLKYVGLHNLPISAEAIARLQAARPDLTIVR